MACASNMALVFAPSKNDRLVRKLLIEPLACRARFYVILFSVATITAFFHVLFFQKKVFVLHLCFYRFTMTIPLSAVPEIIFSRMYCVWGSAKFTCVECFNKKSRQKAPPEDNSGTADKGNVIVKRQKHRWRINTKPGGGGWYFGIKRIGMTVGNPRKLP